MMSLVVVVWWGVVGCCRENLFVAFVAKPGTGKNNVRSQKDLSRTGFPGIFWRDVRQLNEPTGSRCAV